MTKTLYTILRAVLIASHVEVAPITVSAGETVILNFDLTTAVPPLPYDAVAFSPGLNLATFDPGDAGAWTLFSELNATGPGSTVRIHGLLVLTNAAGMEDGGFSASVSMTLGSIIIDPPRQPS